MDVDPIIPPVEKVRGIAELCLFFFDQRVGKFLYVVGHEVLLIVEDEGLK